MGLLLTKNVPFLHDSQYHQLSGTADEVSYHHFHPVDSIHANHGRLQTQPSSPYNQDLYKPKITVIKLYSTYGQPWISVTLGISLPPSLPLYLSFSAHSLNILDTF